jgi:hypothetical protein
VDDAIVVVENIARHWLMKGGRDTEQAAVEAVAEVGNPTIVATLTVVAALLAHGLRLRADGAVHGPIPANASAAMLFSLFVAVIITPWLMLKIASNARRTRPWRGRQRESGGGWAAVYRAVARRVLPARAAPGLPAGRRRDDARRCRLFYTKDVTVKLLPFDNKSESPWSSTCPRARRWKTPNGLPGRGGGRVKIVEEVISIQTYAGDRRAVQLQRPGAPLFLPQESTAGRPGRST